MIEAIEHASSTQLSEHKRFIEGRKEMAKHAVLDRGIDLRRKIEPPTPKKQLPLEPPPVEVPVPPLEVPVQIDWVQRQQQWPTNFIEHIKKVIAREFRQTVLDLISERRTQNYVIPRHVAMYLCKNLTPKSLPEIGRHFGHRDHTTVMHGVRNITAKLLTDSFVCQIVHELQTKLEDDLARWRAGGR